MRTFEVAFMLGVSGVAYRGYKAKDEDGAYKKARRYCTNIILRITEVTQ